MALIQTVKGQGKQCFEMIGSGEIQVALEKPWRDFVKDLEDFMAHGFDFIGNGLDQLEKRKQTALEKLYRCLAGLIDEQLAGCAVDHIDTKTNLLKVSELAKLLHELTATVVQSKIEHDVKDITQAQIDAELQIFQDQMSEITGTGQNYDKNDGEVESDESVTELSHSERMSINNLLS
ncbi:hypothetical protein WICPIJ_002820 [Wickerhamomyces pijperi]|uniref:Uncharacterized protein n=1 Tax=Wickerhamomyces pijperi TaxID=599730 RepID=A0A9P8QB44_WICPI|nr:hypothetical protein WICPIJ_002820 [Wickerhamomyces pijperi]